MAKDKILSNINRVAETHFMLKPALVNALKRQELTEEGQARTGGAKTYYEFWEKSFSDRFFDMGTLIRLGTEVENGMKYYYMDKKGLANLLVLQADPKYKMNIFQRIMPWTNENDSAIGLFKNELAYDLNTNPHFKDVQELMLYRHLYAHNAGLLNEKFVNDLDTLTGKSISEFEGTDAYPMEDTYFFAPLRRLNHFIEATRSFFIQFP